MERKDFSEKANRIFDPSAKLEQLITGYNFTEGPVWDEKQEALYFTNFQDDSIHKWTRTGGAAMYTGNAHRAIGLSITRDGRIVSAETRTHRIAYVDDQTSEVIVDSYQGKRLSSPNDVVVSQQGDIFFTDPYSTAMGDVRELDYNGVFRAVPGSYEPILLDSSMERPNGLAFSPDESILYVDDTNQQNITAFQVRSDRTLSKIGVFATLDTSYGRGAADGMKVDAEGNIYLTGPGGIWVYDKDAQPVTILLLPESAGNLCFGMKDNTTLIITASTSVYTVKTLIPGIVPPRD
ncbi:MAG: SMP-30/gluconolactonase/LRE family protein [Oscillospiraceae bacterium]|nr:SMP-30/gluconolactonase/LRE family protein [Oscillospiraceae bacterium]